ncbi:S9 family peptidase [Flavobacterium flavipallidum]|uniref:Prolyl oligopeptidase family serine peptidase n=1 Tax=Flavobacterium flavipallidum TaxID=3139140 RepID=A0ABU9HJR0_9FLAO
MNKSISKTNSLIIFLFLIFNGYAQEKKLPLTAAEFHKWPGLIREKISDNGQWISFVLSYRNDQDSLFIQNTANNQRLSFPKGKDMQFSPDGNWAMVSSPQQMALVNLKNNQTETISDVVKNEFSANSRFCSFLQKGNRLQIVDLKKGKKQYFSAVSSFAFNPKNKLAVIDSLGVSIIEPDADFSRKRIFEKEPSSISNLLWNNAGTGLIFIEEIPKKASPASYALLYYDLQLQQRFILDTGNKPELDDLLLVKPGPLTKIVFSADDQLIFFYMAPQSELETNTEPIEVWDTSLPLEFPRQRYSGDTKKLPKRVYWNPKTNEIQKISTNELPDLMLSLSRNMGIAFNPLQYEPSFKIDAPIDLYVVDIKKQTQKLFLKKYEYYRQFLGISPDERYISYFKDKNWWIYDCQTDNHRNLTAKLKLPFHEIDYDRPAPAMPYGNPCWTDDGKIILYDQYDIWLLGVDGSAERITHGRENKTTYRIPFSEIPQFRPYSHFNIGRPPLSLAKGLVLSTIGANKNSGYSLYYPNKKLQRLSYDAVLASSFHKAVRNNSYLFVEQASNIPPRIKVGNSFSKAPITLFQSSPQYVNYELPKAELLSYTSKNNSPLQATLYYPKDYDPNKKYPMIVFIYEKLSGDFHVFLGNNYFDGLGFHPINYNLDGYLVLFPDIEYEIGKPAQSTWDCVESGINAVAAKGIVDMNHLGIIGHSFGGYEVNCILTMTSLFKAAVSGAGISDLISTYFHFHPDTEISNMWRIEAQQFRMGKSFFEDQQRYLKNSPIFQSENITTPLLLWSGKADGNVVPSQSMELYMSLRRQNKKALLLLYPNEPHKLTNPDNQSDLKNRIKNWFDHYLKKEPIE